MPTHLNLPDQVLTLWSFSLTARQLLLFLVGAGLGGTLWQHLAVLGHSGVAGEVLRFVLALLPFLCALFVACYQYAGRYLEVWCVVLLRYRLRPTCYLWRSIRASEQHLSPLVPAEDSPDREEDASPDTHNILARREAR